MVGKGDPAKCGYFLNITLKKNFIEDQIKLINSASQVELASAKAVTAEQEEVKEESKDAVAKPDAG